MLAVWMRKPAAAVVLVHCPSLPPYLIQYLLVLALLLDLCVA
jgi:hypothetical protein